MSKSLGRVLRGAALIGLGNSARALAFAVRRVRLDACAQRNAPRGSGVSRVERRPGRVVEASEVPGGGRIRFEHAVAEIRFLDGGGVFVGWDDAGPLPSYALTENPDGDTGSDPAEPAWASDVALEPSWKLSYGKTTVEVDPDGALTFWVDDQMLRFDDPPTWTDIGTDQGWRHRSALSDDAVVLGLGGRSTEPNRRSGSYGLWNTEPGGHWEMGEDPLSITMPVYLVVDDVGCRLAFYDNTFDGVAEVGDARQPGAIELSLSDGPLRYYVFTGSMAEVLERYTALTGRPAMVPQWTLGYHHSRWGHGSESAMRALAEGFRSRDLPLSGLWMDIDHLVEKAVFAVDRSSLPDLAGLTRDLAADDTHVVPIIDPAIPCNGRSPAYDSGMARGAFCRNANGDVARGVCWAGTSVYPDFTSPRTREWWGELFQEYVESGVDGFWHDMNEPSAFVAFGESTLPRSTRHELEGRGGDHHEAHNVYGLEMNRAGFTGLRRLRPERRPFIVSRSGWAGMQRYAGAWTGDISTSWDSLRATLWFTLGLGACGVPWSGPDIGGFTGHPSDELYARWFQLAAYLPFFRTHSSNRVPAREPWAWDAATQDVIRTALSERYALLPYWYSLAWTAHWTGAPYVRPLLWADPTDRPLRSVDDAFLLGDALLVAPVLEPGATSRSVRLPAGRWYDRRDGSIHDGPGEVTLSAGLSDSVPVLMRAGSVVPVRDGAGGFASGEGGEVRLDAAPDVSEDVAAGGSDGPDSGKGPGGVLVTDAGDGWDEPVVERFSIVGDDVVYDGPAATLPYPVRWVSSSG